MIAQTSSRSFPNCISQRQGLKILPPVGQFVRRRAFPFEQLVAWVEPEDAPNAELDSSARRLRSNCTIPGSTEAPIRLPGLVRVRHAHARDNPRRHHAVTVPEHVQKPSLQIDAVHLSEPQGQASSAHQQRNDAVGPHLVAPVETVQRPFAHCSTVPRSGIDNDVFHAGSRIRPGHCP